MLNLKQKSTIVGFTLVELMVSLAINALLFGAIITVFISNVGYYNRVINSNRLNQELQMILTLMSNDIRRAGYWSNAASDIGTGQNNNPFVASAVDVSINASNNCILFAYDRNGNGLLPTISNAYDDERYGYRLMGGAIQARPPGASFSCTASQSAWENMTDPNVITITGLTFTLTSKTVASGSSSLIMRSVDITVTGRLNNDATITKSVTQHVRIRNDKYVP